MALFRKPQRALQNLWLYNKVCYQGDLSFLNQGEHVHGLKDGNGACVSESPAHSKQSKTLKFRKAAS